MIVNNIAEHKKAICITFDGLYALSKGVKMYIRMETYSNKRIYDI